eukprot:1115453-Amorphochlora_amoeboformis.AAC.1
MHPEPVYPDTRMAFKHTLLDGERGRVGDLTLVVCVNIFSVYAGVFNIHEKVFDLRIDEKTRRSGGEMILFRI